MKLPYFIKDYYNYISLTRHVLGSQNFEVVFNPKTRMLKNIFQISPSVLQWYRHPKCSKYWGNLHVRISSKLVGSATLSPKEAGTMFGMDNLDLESVNRQFLLEAQGYIGGGGGSGASSTNSSAADLYLYDDSSSSAGSTYSYGSDQENSNATASSTASRSRHRLHRRRSKCPQQQVRA